jgi:hypothetical protein
MFFLISDMDMNIIEVCKLKANIINMILRFCKKYFINSITIKEQFTTALPVGKYLVQTDTDGMEFSVYVIGDIGYLREYKEAIELYKIKIVEFIPVEVGLTDEERQTATGVIDLRMTFKD